MKKQAGKPVLELSEAETKKLIYELKVHQIELEMQKDELLRTKTNLEEVSDKYNELFDFAPCGYFILNEDGTIEDLNLAAAKMAGKTRSQLKGSSFGFFVSDDSRPLFNNFLGKAFETRFEQFCEVTFVTDRNNLKFIRLSGIVKEKNTKCFVLAIDLTLEKLAEKEIKLKNEQLVKVNAEKDKFLSIIAHDLRSPFNSFLGLTQILAEELPDLTADEIRNIVFSMRTSAINFYNFLENLLHWAKVQQGLVVFNPKLAKLLPAVNESITLLIEPAKIKKIDLSCNIPDNIEVYTDVNILYTVIRNLVSNAIKFTPKGGDVKISAKVVRDEKVEICIQDSGIGMSRLITDNLFRIGIQSNRQGTEGEPSTGLGLIICKDFIESQGEKLIIESEEGIGSIFKFTLPVFNKNMKIG